MKINEGFKKVLTKSLSQRCFNETRSKIRTFLKRHPAFRLNINLICGSGKFMPLSSYLEGLSYNSFFLVLLPLLTKGHKMT